MVLGVRLQVLGELPDSCGGKRDLDLRRSCVLFCSLVFRDQLALDFCLYCQTRGKYTGSGLWPVQASQLCGFEAIKAGDLMRWAQQLQRSAPRRTLSSLHRHGWCQTCQIGECKGAFGARRVESALHRHVWRLARRAFPAIAPTTKPRQDPTPYSPKPAQMASDERDRPV